MLAETPLRSSRRPFEELSGTPPPPSAPRVLRRCAASVQRFSLRSRRARPYPEGTAQVPVQPGDTCLHLPMGVRGQWPSGVVKLCPCTWRQQILVPGRPRLCQRDTEDHDEYRALELMSWRYATERGAESSTASLIAAGAALRELDAHFIIQPESNVVAGYVAFGRDGAGPRPVIVQLYIMPEYRRKGMAAAALKVLLAGHHEIDVVDPTLAFNWLLKQLRFARASGQAMIQSEDEASMGEQAPTGAHVRYRRARPAISGDGENML